MSILNQLGKKTIFFDGAMGTMLQKNGLKGGDIPELLNLTRPELLEQIHSEYLEAGCDVITANTFGANSLKEEAFGCDVDDIILAAISVAKKAAQKYSDTKPRYVALDIGPTGKLLEPMGDLSFDECYEVFKKTAVSGEKAGADLVIIETMSDTLEAKAAVLAVKENTNLPVFCTMTFDETHKTLTGANVTVVTAMFEGLGVDCIGINCGLGPEQIKDMMADMAKVSSIPIMAQPNAGLPVIENGKTVFTVEPDEFGTYMTEIAKVGASVLGGCCGTTPEHIKRMIELCSEYSPIVTKKEDTIVTSYSSAVYLGLAPKIIGERINPTGKKKFKEALKNDDIDYILGEAISQQEAGAHILDVNVGLPEIDEAEVMVKAVKAIQATVNLPLQIDSSEPPVLERALRIYNGKPMINSVNGKEECMKAVFPLVKKYGGVVVGLALDESGIPETAEGRYLVAKKIVDTAESYGIERKNIVIDALTLTVSAQQKESAETVKALAMIKERLGVKTVLGVSNISFGLPRRELINSTFFALALYSGLDACIINPCANAMMDAYRSFCALIGYDENCTEYIGAYTGTTAKVTVTKAEQGGSGEIVSPTGNEVSDNLFNLIVKGLKDQSYDATAELLKISEPLDIINNVLVKALDVVGKQFEKGTMFLPQLMMSAETVKNAFAAIKTHIEKSGNIQESKGKIVIATVKGDIHDIGKNIVRVLLENYGYDVIDLGKDVPPELIVETLRDNDIHMCGLSALMTTTVISMEQTIKAIREAGLDVKVMVGGAVLTQEYADMIGADFYGKDALATVNYANELTASA